MWTGKMLTSLILAWLIPGAGHLYLKRTATGLILLGAMGILLTAGMLTGLSSSQIDLGVVDWLYWFSRLSNGLTFLGTPVLSGLSNPSSATEVPNVNFEYGRISLVIVGLLNYLAILNIYDICQNEYRVRGRK
ncbi:MAG: hypothetical protein H7Z37_01140 [Pyrinomonadaceae bacterium]|nr:hypothetical protein [Pyrinomonadaceae bacterium]